MQNYKYIDKEKIFEIIQTFPNDYINSINKNFDINQIYFDWNKKFVNEKILETKRFKYYNNFELIDVNLMILLITKKDIKNIFNYGRFILYHF